MSSRAISRAINKVANAVLEFNESHVNRAHSDNTEGVANTFSKTEATALNVVVNDIRLWL